MNGKNMKTVALTLVVGLMMSVSAFAQKELVGNWRFESQESISGRLYANGSPVVVRISLKDDLLTIEKGSYDADSAMVYISEALVAGGKAFETVTATKRKKVVTLKKDGERYVELATLYNAGDASKVDRKVTDVWSIADGKLVLERRDENLMNGETWESKAIYGKQ